jgi:hypothetical protein
MRREFTVVGPRANLVGMLPSRVGPFTGALRRFVGPEPLVSALSVLSAAVFGVDGSREASISVQNRRFSTTNHSQVVCNECIQTMEMPVQEASFSAMTQTLGGG